MKQNSAKRQRIRSGFLIATFLLFPVIMFYFSPYLFIWGASKGLVTAGFFSFATLFFLSLFLGRSMCGWIMPCGALQEILCSVNNSRSGKGKSRYIKYIWFTPWLIAALIVFLQAGGYKKIEYFFHLKDIVSLSSPRMYIPYYSVILLFTLTSVIGGRRANCHYLCWMSPFMILGKKLNGLLALPSLRMQTVENGCTGCKRCAKECPMSLEVDTMINGGTIEHSDCILCGRCADACPRNLLHFTFCRPQKAEKKHIREKE